MIVRVFLAPGLEPGRDVGSIDLHAVVGTTNVVDMRVTTSSRGMLPLTFGLTSSAGMSSAITVTARANAPDGSPLVTRTVETHFIHAERRVLDVVLDPACRTVTCNAGGNTCIGGSCQLDFVDPSNLPGYAGMLPDASFPDVGIDAAHDAGVDAHSCYADAGVMGEPDGCVLRRPPTRPNCTTGSDGMTRTFAFLDPVIDQSHNVWATSSYDLDGLCSDALAMGPSECQVAVDTLQDGPGGTDDAFGEAILEQLLTIDPNYAMNVHSEEADGVGVPILQLTQWNGQADDDRVDVIIATTVDVLPSSAGAVPASMVTLPNSYPPPNWDGMDTAYAANNYFSMVGNVPQIHDDNAYVSNHVLVASLPDRAPFDVPSHATGTRPGVVRIRLTDTRFIATLSSDGTTVMGGVLIGRWAYADVVGYLPALAICPGTTINDMYIHAFNLIVTRALDVRSAPGSGGPGIACDALSVALPFTRGVPVAWGGVSPIALVPGTCP
jgi:hypothetical protein